MCRAYGFMIAVFLKHKGLKSPADCGLQNRNGPRALQLIFTIASVMLLSELPACIYFRIVNSIL
jgi:hypothetical protein